ncbi:MAG: Na+/H+ antiporter subunit E [Vallitalea sp.]|nr:Na+/H+ antiporter subunit E [Vallitalea sp.]
MKYLINNKLFILFLLVFWCILNGDFSLITIMQGFIFSSLAMIISCTIPGGADFIHTLNISFFMFVRFIIILIANIYSSTFAIIKLIFTSNINPHLVHINTNLENDWLLFFLANAITLTPGTVTVNRKGSDLLVLTAYSNDSTQIMDSKLVKALRKGVKH